MIEYQGVVLTDEMQCPAHGPEDFVAGCEPCLVAGAYADPGCCVSDGDD